MDKSKKFDNNLQELARFAKAVSHPARLAILKYLAETKTCISGDISDYIPLSRTTVSQHLQELKRSGLIHGEIDGTRICYCICQESVKKVQAIFNNFFCEVGENIENSCNK